MRHLIRTASILAVLLAGCQDPASLPNEIPSVTDDISGIYVPAQSGHNLRAVGNVAIHQVPETPAPTPTPTPTPRPTASPAPTPSPTR